MIGFLIAAVVAVYVTHFHVQSDRDSPRETRSLDARWNEPYAPTREWTVPA